MGEPFIVHIVDGYGDDTACGKPWRDVPITLIRYLATCPGCWTAYRLTRPTVQVMDGETGEDAISWDPWVCTRFDASGEPIWERPWQDMCPAPTPRAP